MLLVIFLFFFFNVLVFFVFFFQTNRQPNKRICPSESERSSKRQRIAHINKNNNIIVKDSVNKSSKVDKPSKTSPSDSKEVSPLAEKEEVESSTTGNIGEFTSAVILSRQQ